VNRIIVVALALGVSACVSTSQMQLAPNVYRVETNASGLLFVGQAGDETLKRAAELTLAKGYTHFKLAEAGYGTGSEVYGVSQGPTYGSATVSGNTVYGRTYTAPATVMRRPTEKAAATVIMFNADDPNAAGAFDAKQLLAEKSA
jgi:hypothetical protein